MRKYTDTTKLPSGHPDFEGKMRTVQELIVNTDEREYVYNDRGIELWIGENKVIKIGYEDSETISVKLYRKYSTIINHSTGQSMDGYTKLVSFVVFKKYYDDIKKLLDKRQHILYMNISDKINSFLDE